MFRSLFSRKKKPTGAPAVRRLKTYAAESGYVYQYYYEGCRAARSGGEAGRQYVFRLSERGGKWAEAGVFIPEAVVARWQSAHARELASNELYAVAKMALFQAFDERLTPAQMRDEVRVREADIEAIGQDLGW